VVEYIKNEKGYIMEYSIIYSKRKTISLVVKSGELIVRAPMRASKRNIEKLVEAHMEWINRTIEKTKNAPKVEEISAEKEKLLRKQAKVVLGEKANHYSQMMGLKYGRITITGAKTRFGSCSSKGNISFSYRLMMYPEDAIDYVVVHELAHLVELNHSPRFWAIVESVFPDYKRRRKLLKEQK
jgi:predicted metal-dependent hydrolase